jgi:membrane protein insertase Oxa1/YidC/SpoIIIJ
MQGVGRADVLFYFKCPTTKQMRCSVNPYQNLIKEETNMAEQTKIVKGGFRATLALLISIIALVLSILAYNRATDQTTLNAEINNLQTKMNDVKKETAEQMDKIRQETGQALQKIGESIKSGN